VQSDGIISFMKKRHACQHCGRLMDVGSGQYVRRKGGYICFSCDDYSPAVELESKEELAMPVVSGVLVGEPNLFDEDDESF